MDPPAWVHDHPSLLFTFAKNVDTDSGVCVCVCVWQKRNGEFRIVLLKTTSGSWKGFLLSLWDAKSGAPRGTRVSWKGTWITQVEGWSWTRFLQARGKQTETAYVTLLLSNRAVPWGRDSRSPRWLGLGSVQFS